MGIILNIQLSYHNNNKKNQSRPTTIHHCVKVFGYKKLIKKKKFRKYR